MYSAAGPVLVRANLDLGIEKVGSMVLYVWIMKHKTGMMVDDVVKGVYSAAGPVEIQLFAVMGLRFA